MALEAAFNDLHQRLLGLRETLQAAQLTIREDQPLRDGVLLVDQVGDSVDDLLGWLEEAITDAHTSKHTIEQRTNIYGTLRALISCQERIDRVGQRMLSDALHHQRIAELTRLGRKRGGEWRSWTGSVIQSLDACCEPLFEAQHALVVCWRELIDQVGTITHVVEAMQHYSLRPPTDLATMDEVGADSDTITQGTVVREHV